jgi:hypothetical protein
LIRLNIVFEIIESFELLEITVELPMSPCLVCANAAPEGSFMTVTIAGGTGTTAYELMWNPVDRRGGVCQPYKNPPPPQRFKSMEDVNQHFATINGEVNRMTSRVNSYREGRSEYSWDELKNMCDCLAGQISQLAAAAARFLGKEAARDYIRAMRSNHEWNVKELEKYRPRFER